MRCADFQITLQTVARGPSFRVLDLRADDTIAERRQTKQELDSEIEAAAENSNIANTEIAADLKDLCELYRSRGLAKEEAEERALEKIRLSDETIGQLVRIHESPFRRWLAGSPTAPNRGSSGPRPALSPGSSSTGGSGDCWGSGHKREAPATIREWVRLQWRGADRAPRRCRDIGRLVLEEYFFDLDRETGNRRADPPRWPAAGATNRRPLRV